MKKSKDGKTEFITIRVTDDLKQRIENARKKEHPNMPLNTFLGELIEMGLKEEEMWIEIKESRAKYIKDDVLMRSFREMRKNGMTYGIPKERFIDETENETGTTGEGVEITEKKRKEA